MPGHRWPEPVQEWLISGAGGRELKTGAVADGLDFGTGASAEGCSVVGGKDAAGDAAAGAWATGVGW